MEEPYSQFFGFMQRPVVLDTLVNMLLCAVPIWVAVMIRLVVATAVDGAGVPRPPQPRAVPLDGAPGVWRAEAVVRVHGTVSILGVPAAVGAVQGKGRGRSRGGKCLGGAEIGVRDSAAAAARRGWFQLASCEVFGPDQPIVLKLLGSERSFQALEDGACPERQSPPGFDTATCRSVYMGNIHPNVTESLLTEVFQSMRPLEGCKLIRKEKMVLM